MRIPKPDEDLIGKVCVSSIGRIAIVTGQDTKIWANGKIMWHGIGFDGKGTWASSNPCVAYETIEEYRKMLSARFNGKISYHG